MRRWTGNSECKQQASDANIEMGQVVGSCSEDETHAVLAASDGKDKSISITPLIYQLDATYFFIDGGEMRGENGETTRRVDERR